MAALGLVLALLIASPRVAAHSPHDVVTVVAVSPDFQRDQLVLAVARFSTHRVFCRSVDGGRSWERVGLPMLQHGVTAIRFSPHFTTDRTLFAATALGGVYRSTDGGIRWTERNVGLGSLAVRDLAVSHAFARDRTLAVATAEGCFMSRDAGQTWSAAEQGLVESDLTAVRFVSASKPRELIVAGRLLHRSTSAGHDWQPTAVFDEPVSALAVSPRFDADATLAVSFGVAGAVQISTDGGTSFLPSAEGLTDPAVNDLVFAHDGTLFAATSDKGCFRSDGPFQPWTMLVEGLDNQANQASKHYLSVAVSPAFARDDVVFLGSFEGLYRSDDRGDAWRQRDLYHQRINRALILSPDFGDDGMLLLGNYGGGPLLLKDGAWSAIGNGIRNLDMYSGSMAISPSFPSDGKLLLGFSSIWRSDAFGQNWVNVLPAGGGLGGTSVTRSLAFSPGFGSDQLAYRGTGGGGLWRSKNGGTIWKQVLAGLPADLVVRAFAFSPEWATDRTMFIATSFSGVFRSMDAGRSWVALSNGLPQRPIRSVKVSPGYPTDGTLFAATTGAGLYRSTDAGTSWHPANGGLPDTVGLDIEGLDVSPGFTVDRTLFLSTDRRAGLFKSTDGGDSWTSAANGLPADQAGALAVSPDFRTDQTVYLATTDWLWRTTDAAVRWERISGFVRAPDSHGQMFYSGTWDEHDPAPLGAGAAHGDSVTSSSEAGASFEYDFYGDSIAWHAIRTPDSGIAAIELDGEPQTLVDLHVDVPLSSAPVWSTTFRTPGWHTLRVLVTGAADPASMGAAIHSDGVAFTF